MPEYLYTVWFQDSELRPGDQDYEWPACILITAASPVDAQRWGDHLAIHYCFHSKCVFLSSEVEPELPENVSGVPRVAFGEVASDVDIGW